MIRTVFQSRRRVLCMAIALAVMVALWLGRGTDRAMSSPTTTAEPTTENDIERARSVQPTQLQPGMPRVPPALAAAAPEEPIIDEILVEKSSVCEGEENLITVRAHTPGGEDDAYMHYQIGGQRGRTIPVRRYLPDDKDVTPAPLMVSVFGRNNTVTRAEVPPFEVKRCRTPRTLALGYRMVPNGVDEFLFHARVRNNTADDAFEAVEYHWNFGDGTEMVTAEPFVEHSYREREQDRMFADYVVTCTAVAASGERVTGRSGFELLSDSYEHFAHKGIVLLRTAMTPRFPVMDESGRVTQTATIWHDYDRPVRVTRILRGRHSRAGQMAEPPREIDVAGLLGSDIVPPKTPVTVRVSFDAGGEEDIFSHEYLILGESEDGWRSAGGFSVMRPPERPTRENNRPVRDPLLAAKIMRARELTGKQLVTDEDLWRLERKGAFEGLQPMELDPQKDWQPQPQKSRD